MADRKLLQDGSFVLLQDGGQHLLQSSASGTDDFTFTGTDGSNWGSGWTFTQGTGDILTNRGRMVTGTGGFDGRSARYTTGLSDISLRIDVEIPTNDAQFPEVRLRYDSTNQDYVRLLFEPHNDTVYLHDYDNDVQQTLLDSASFAIAANDIVHIRAVMVGASILVRLWLNGDAEPTTWQVEGTTSFGQTNTQLMVRTVTSNLGVAITNYWDNLSYTTAVSGTSAVTLDNAASAITGDVTGPITGTIAVTLDDVTSSISGTEEMAGTISTTLADATSAITGTVAITGTIATTLADATSLITAAATDGEITEPFASTPDWTVLSGGFTIASGTLRPSATATDSNAHFNELMVTDDCFVQADLITSSDVTDVYHGVIARWNGADINGAATSAYVLQQNFSDLVLYSVTSGPTYNTIATYAGVLSTPGTYTIRLLVVGTTIQAYLNGTLQGSYTDSAVTTGRHVGVSMYSASSVTDTQIDNFVAGFADLTISGTIVTTLDNATSAITASHVQNPTGTIATTLADATSSITAVESIPGTIATTLDNATSSITGSGATQPDGPIETTLDNVTSNFVGAVEIPGVIAAVVADATSSISGAATLDITGTIDAVLDNVACFVQAQRYGKEPDLEMRPTIIFHGRHRRRYYDPNKNPVTRPSDAP